MSERKSKIDMDDMWVCDYCGTEEVSQSAWVNINTETMIDFIDGTYWCESCEEETEPITYFEFKEKIIEECGGNKDKYDKIMDGSRM
tara:strand:- start:4296 stop:4556 length:261 start_codon:yes stop_codon:yes gene_type:complete